LSEKRLGTAIAHTLLPSRWDCRILPLIASMEGHLGLVNEERMAIWVPSYPLSRVLSGANKGHSREWPCSFSSLILYETCSVRFLFEEAGEPGQSLARAYAVAPESLDQTGCQTLHIRNELGS
jgi:hypothetical protein